MAVAIDPSSPSIIHGLEALTTASFSPPADSVLVAHVFIEDSSISDISTQVVISNTGTARTWTLRVSRQTSQIADGNSYGAVAIFTAPNPTALSGITVTMSIPSLTAYSGFKAQVVTGGDLSNPVAALGYGHFGTNSSTPTVYTSTVADSLGLIAAQDWFDQGMPSSTDVEEAFTSGGLAGMAIVKSSTTPTPGTAVTANMDASGSSSTRWIWVAVEMRPNSTVSATINLSVVSRPVSVPSPSRSTGSQLTTSLASVSASTPSASLSAGASANPDAVSIPAETPAPSVAAGSVELVSLDTVQTTSDVPAPDVFLGQTIPAPEVVPTGSVPEPALSAQLNTIINADAVLPSASVPVLIVSVPVLPGDLMTGDYQIEYAEEILFGEWPYIILTDTVEGWDDLVELDSGNTLKPREHGASPGSKFGQQRYVSATILVSDESDDFMARITASRRATRAPRGAAEPDLVIRTRGETLLARGSIAARVLPPNLYHAGFAAVALRWECSDPRRYSLQQYSQTLAVNDTETVTNAGDEDSLPRIRITGPAEYPSITNLTLGLTLAFAIQLENGERLDVDCSTGTVRIGNQNYESALADLSVPVKMWSLAPGDNEVLYETESAGLGGIEILWRDAYM